MSRFRSGLSYLLLICLVLAIMSGPERAAAQNGASPSAYAVEGLPLGGQVKFDSTVYAQYQCTPSDQFSGFKWCQRKSKVGAGQSAPTKSNTILHTSDGTAQYINVEIEPASFGPNEIAGEIARLSAKYGQAKVITLPRRDGLPEATIASWGRVQLEPLDADSVATLAAGGSIKKGLLVEFLGEFRKSARLKLPIYRLDGGAGFVWAASRDDSGKGRLRFFAIDAAALGGRPASSGPALAGQGGGSSTSRNAGFTDFAQLIEMPQACKTARMTPRSQMYVRDPFLRQQLPGPACIAVTQCLGTLAPQVLHLARYLQERPALRDELRTRSPNALQALSRSIDAAAGGPPSDCSYAYVLTTNNFLDLDVRSSSPIGFEAFAAAANSYLQSLQSEFRSGSARYEEVRRVLQRYDRADDLARIKSTYDSAYNGSDIEAFLRLRPEFAVRLDAAEQYRTGLDQQARELGKLEERASDLVQRASNPALARLLEESERADAEKLKSDIQRSQAMTAGERGQISRELAQLTQRADDIDRQFTRVSRLETQRQDTIRDLHAAQATTAKLRDRLRDEAATAIAAKLQSSIDRLVVFGDAPGGNSQDEALQAAAVILKDSRAIESSAREIDAFADEVDQLNRFVDQRGRRYLDGAATASLAGLTGSAAQLRISRLPLNDEDAASLPKQSALLRSAKVELPKIMDAQEQAYLISTFPIRHNGWSIQVRTDKLTDVRSVVAQGETTGEEAKYEIELGCAKGTTTLDLFTFRREGKDGKPISWDLRGEVKFVRFRIDDRPADQAMLLSAGHSNSGRLKFNNLDLIASSRIVVGDVFPRDQIEIPTRFPDSVRRLCSFLKDG